MADDRTIVTNVLARRAGSFEALVQRHRGLVWHLLYRRTGNADDAQDLMQEVFLRVYQKLGQFRFQSSLATWIGRISYSIAARHAEKKRLDIVDDERQVADASAHVDPQRTAQRDAMSAALENQLAMLNPVQRTIVSLYHQDEMTVAEIAAIVDEPVGTVKSHLFRARKRMRKALESVITQEDLYDE